VHISLKVNEYLVKANPYPYNGASLSMSRRRTHYPTLLTYLGQSLPL